MAATKLLTLREIKQRWKLSPEIYDELCAECEKALKTRKIHGLRIQGSAAQRALNKAITDIIATMHGQQLEKDIGTKRLRDDLRRLAQTLNYNQRRRTQRDHEPKKIQAPRRPSSSCSSTAAYSAPSDASSRSKSPERVLVPADSVVEDTRLQSIGFKTIVISHQEQGEIRTYRPTDFCDKTGDRCLIEVDDLLFKRFEELITLELSYHKQSHFVQYPGPTGRDIKVMNERAWRAALWDMCTQGLRHLSFTIRARISDPYSPA